MSEIMFSYNENAAKLQNHYKNSCPQLATIFQSHNIALCEENNNIYIHIL